MSCPETELLSAYADGEAGPERARELEAHLEACAACRLRLESLKASKAAVREAAPVPPMPAELRESLLAMAREADARAARTRESAAGRPEPGWLDLLRAAMARPAYVLPLAALTVLALVFWTRHRMAVVPKVELPVDFVVAAHNQYTLTMPLAPTEKILTETPVMTAGSLEGRDVY